MQLRVASQKGVGPNAGDGNLQRFVVTEEDVFGSVYITIHYCLAIIADVGLCSTKVVFEVSAGAAGLAGVGFVDDSELASVLATLESEALAEAVVGPGCHLARGLGSDFPVSLADHLGNFKFGDHDEVIIASEVGSQLFVDLVDQVADAIAQAADGALEFGSALGLFLLVLGRDQ